MPLFSTPPANVLVMHGNILYDWSQVSLGASPPFCAFAVWVSSPPFCVCLHCCGRLHALSHGYSRHQRCSHYHVKAEACAR